jgi:isopenicillin-N epimerase
MIGTPDLSAAALRGHWTLDPELRFLNHGSFGATPAAVLDEQRAWRDRMERGPVQFLARDLPRLLDEARGELARFVGADPGGLVFVPNATTGVNAVLRSLRLDAGDELVTTDHAYNACRNALDYAAERHGARVVVVRVPFPLASADAIVDGVVAALTPRTRLVVVDHVTSETGLVLPIERIAAELAVRDVDLLVDGAHAPGMLGLDLEVLGAAYYTGNCHKWICAPKGAAFLSVRADRRAGVRPQVISHGANTPRAGFTRLQDEFDWCGTDDPTAWLSVPASIRFLDRLLPGGWPELRARNKALVVRGRELLCEALGIDAPCPEELLGSLASVPLPPLPGGPREPDPLHAWLYSEHRIEVPVMNSRLLGVRLLRISAQAYNAEEEYQALADALRAAPAELLPR